MDRLATVLAAEGEPNPLLPHTSELIVGIIAFVLLFLFLRAKVFPVFEKTFAERHDAIEGGMERARTAEEEAKELLAQYREQLADARHEAARLRESAREQGAQIIAEMREEAQAESRRLTEQAHQQIEADKSQALNSLRAEVGTLATTSPAASSASRSRTTPASAGSSTASSRSSRRGPTVPTAVQHSDGRRKPFGVARMRPASLQGASRESFAAARETLGTLIRSGDTDLHALGDELFAVTAVLDEQGPLRRALTDPSRNGDDRTALARGVFADKVGASALDVLAWAVRARWSGSRDLADAIELLAVDALMAAAEKAGRLETVEDELFRLGRIVAGAPELRSALTDQSAPVESRSALIEGLLEGKVTDETRRLVVQAVTAPRGRTFDSI